VGCKDLGAGGLGGASSELVLAGGFGAEIDLDRVPMGEPGLRPHQVLCGETQERFVWALPERWAQSFCDVFNRDYELDRVYPNARAAVIGRVVAERVYRCRWHGDTVVDLGHAILEDSPIAARSLAPRTEAAPTADPLGPGETGGDAAWQAWAEEILARPNRASRAPIYRGYDQEVQGRAFLRPGEADAGVVRPIPGAALGLAVAVDGNPDYGRLDPYWGGALAVLESVRNVVATGAVPIALTDCLNFGNPEEPVALGEMEAALRGMHDACVAVGSPGRPEEPLPLVSGNVSLYNQSSRGGPSRPRRSWPASALSRTTPAPSPKGSALRARRSSCSGDASGTGDVPGPPRADACRTSPSPPRSQRSGPPRPPSPRGSSFRLTISPTADSSPPPSRWRSARRGRRGTGVDLDLTPLGSALPLHEALLSESPGFLLEIAPDDGAALRRIAAEQGVACFEIGRVTARPELTVRHDAAGASPVCLDLHGLHRAYRRGLAPTFLDPGADGTATAAGDHADRAADRPGASPSNPGGSR
jgi:phosphoribosylformylglycinamidine (FGAM) synthase-like enzyme